MRYTIKSLCRLTAILVFSFCGITYSQSKEPADYVDPFIGTDFFGHTFPGASLPNSLVHLSPDIHTEGWTYCAGYIYSERSLLGFVNVVNTASGTAVDCAHRAVGT